MTLHSKDRLISEGVSDVLTQSEKSLYYVYQYSTNDLAKLLWGWITIRDWHKGDLVIIKLIDSMFNIEWEPNLHTRSLIEYTRYGVPSKMS